MDLAGVAPADGGGEGTPSPPPAPDPLQPDPGSNVLTAILQLLQQPRARHFQFARGADGRITGATEISGGDGGPPPPQQTPQGPPPGGLYV
jgi:hypothetical protein